MSVEISFDEESAVASIPLADWPPLFVEYLGRYFDIHDAELRLDYSHLPTESHCISFHRLFAERTEREDFVFAFEAAALQGPIALTLKILGYEGAGVEHSSSILDMEAYRGALSDFYEDVLKHTRESIVAEISPRAISVSWLFKQYSSRRARLLDDQEIMAALVASTSEADCIYGLQLVKAHGGENNWAFEQLIQKHWLHVLEYIKTQVGRELGYSASHVNDIVFTLFENSETVQASRDVCLEVVDRANPMIFPRLIQHCRSLVESDVRRLLLRWHIQAKTGKKDDAQDCVTAACSMLASLLRDAMPSDLALAGAWHGFEPALPRQQGVAASLRELPTGSWDRDVLWSQLGPAAREAWRQDLFDQVKDESELAQGLVGFACLWLEQTAFAEVEPVLLRLMDDEDQLTFASQLAATGSRQVLFRAKGLVRSKQGALDLDGSTGLGADVTPLPSVGAKTWLGDQYVERVIHREMSRVEGEFCQEYSETWGEDEEAHTARLLALTQKAMVEAAHRMHQLSATNRKPYPSLSVKVRQPSKREEGACTPKGAPLGADVLFLTRIVDQGKTVIQRATLVQVKKRRGTGSGTKFSSTIGVELHQCEDMLKQSEHAYYMFMTPATSLPTLWVAPARLVRNLTQLHTSKTSIKAIQVRDASCSYADFFLHHLVGLWAGDENEDIVAIANGDPRLGRTPRHIVDIEVRTRSEASAND